MQNPSVILDSHFYNSNKHYKYPYSRYDCIVASGVDEWVPLPGEAVFEHLKQFKSSNNDWLLGYLSYDIKNELEKLSSTNSDGLKFPNAKFFVPQVVLLLNGNTLEIEYKDKSHTVESITQLFKEINTCSSSNKQEREKIALKQRISKEEYVRHVSEIIKHIKQGDIYELNYCMEFFNKHIAIKPFEVYQKLMQVSPTPFSVYLSMDEIHLMSATPERFIYKTADKLVSQPIKGTIRRGQDTVEDEALKHQLKTDTKEIAENVMIVDLVRNDLSRSAARGSVQVEELCGIYTFKQVHQMISTISCKLDDKVNAIDAIKYAFPMGSMTGAPKIRAMELIEKFEQSKRGIFSGAVGYISPNGDFDFNVIIRSILYNSRNNYLSYSVGGAITAKSNPESEYAECMLKASAMKKALQ